MYILVSRFYKKNSSPLVDNGKLLSFFYTVISDGYELKSIR